MYPLRFVATMNSSTVATSKGATPTAFTAAKSGVSAVESMLQIPSSSLENLTIASIEEASLKKLLEDQTECIKQHGILQDKAKTLLTIQHRIQDRINNITSGLLNFVSSANNGTNNNNFVNNVNNVGVMEGSHLGNAESINVHAPSSLNQSSGNHHLSSRSINNGTIYSPTLAPIVTTASAVSDIGGSKAGPSGSAGSISDLTSFDTKLHNQMLHQMSIHRQMRMQQEVRHIEFTGIQFHYRTHLYLL
jgi:hypothetical protein